MTIRKQKVENDWNALFDADGKLISIDLLKEFAQLYSSATDYSSRIDDLYWEWAMSQSDVLSAAADYNGYYNGMGKHSPEVAGLQSLYREWQAIDNTDIFEVIKYIEDHPDTPLRARLTG